MYQDTYKPDPQTQAKVDEWENKVKKITDRVVATSPEILTRSYGESAPTGNLITDALMYKVPYADASFYNAGGIRTELPKGNITYGDVLSMYPFTNDVMSVEISGKDLKAIMSHAADLKNGMLHVSKTVKFKYDSTKPLGQRIVEFDIKGKPVADNTFYTVALDSFIGKGGGGFDFTKGKNVKYIKGLQTSQAIVDYMEHVKTSFRIILCALTTSVNKNTLMRPLPGRIFICFTHKAVIYRPGRQKYHNDNYRHWFPDFYNSLTSPSPQITALWSLC